MLTRFLRDHWISNFSNLQPYHHQAKEASAVAEMKRLRQEAAQVGTFFLGLGVSFPFSILLVFYLVFQQRYAARYVSLCGGVSFTLRHEVQTLRARVAELEVY